MLLSVLVAGARIEAQDGKQQWGSSGWSTKVSPEKNREQVKRVRSCEPTLGPGPLTNSQGMGQGRQAQAVLDLEDYRNLATIATKQVSKQMAASVS